MTQAKIGTLVVSSRKMPGAKMVRNKDSILLRNFFRGFKKTLSGEIPNCQMRWQRAWKCWKWARSKQSPEEAEEGGARQVTGRRRISGMYLKIPNPGLCDYMWPQDESPLSDGPQAWTLCCGSQSGVLQSKHAAEGATPCHPRPAMFSLGVQCGDTNHWRRMLLLFCCFLFHTCLSQLATDTEGSKRTEKEETVNTVSMPVQGHSHGMVTMEERSLPWAALEQGRGGEWAPAGRLLCSQVLKINPNGDANYQWVH